MDDDMVHFSIVSPGIKVPVPDISMPVNSTILDLKQQIKKHIDLDIDRQTLLYYDEELDDDTTIDEDEFGELPTLELLRPPLMYPTGETKINVSVKFGTEKANIKVFERDSTADLRAEIAKHWGVPVQDTILYRLSKEIEDKGNLLEYRIYEGSEVEMKLKVKT